MHWNSVRFYERGVIWTSNDYFIHRHKFECLKKNPLALKWENFELDQNIIPIDALSGYCLFWVCSTNSLPNIFVFFRNVWSHVECTSPKLNILAVISFIFLLKSGSIYRTVHPDSVPFPNPCWQCTYGDYGN